MDAIKLLKTLERVMDIQFSEDGVYEHEGFTMGFAGDTVLGDNSYLGLDIGGVTTFVPVHDVAGVADMGAYIEVMNERLGALVLIKKTVYGGVDDGSIPYLEEGEEDDEETTND